MISLHKPNKKLTQEILDTSYSIPLSLRKDGQLSHYYILRWSLSFYILQPTLSAGFIYHQGQRYKIAYAPKTLIEKSGKESVFLSFRCPSISLQKSGLVPTCYVTFVNTCYLHAYEGASKGASV